MGNAETTVEPSSGTRTSEVRGTVVQPGQTQEQTARYGTECRPTDGLSRPRTHQEIITNRPQSTGNLLIDGLADGASGGAHYQIPRVPELVVDGASTEVLRDRVHGTQRTENVINGAQRGA